MKLTTKSINRELNLNGQSVMALIRFSYYYDDSFDVEGIICGHETLSGKKIEEQAVWHVREWIKRQDMESMSEHFKSKFL